MTTYAEFLAAKMCAAPRKGFSVNPDSINALLKPHQRDIVRWMLDGGRRACFAAFGLGKTMVQLEAMRHVAERESGRQLIVCPLGVRQEFFADAAKLGMAAPTFIRRNEEVSGPGLYLTNYESIRDGRLDVSHFNAVSLDEASVLRSFGSKTYQTFLGLFSGCQYRFVATATPSPNRYKELIHYAAFLGVMDSGQALTRFFQRDSTKANNLTLYPHKVDEFWLWVSSWAIFLQKPSDLGHSDDGYILPDMHVHYHPVSCRSEVSVDRDGQMQLIPDAALSLQAAAREKRSSLPARIEKMVEIISDNPDDHCIVWHDQEAERHAIKKALPEAVEVYGSQDLDERESSVIAFGNGKIKYLATKPILSGSGCNFQRHCAMAIFLGIGFKFNDFIQSCHRIHRFLQERECHIHIIYAHSEVNVLEVLKRKWRQHEEMVEKMSDLIRKYGLSHADMANELRRFVDMERLEVRGETFTAVNNDCVEEARSMAENSVDMILTSVPFCYDEQTEVLTRRGWIGFDQLRANADDVATVNPNTGSFEWQTPSGVVWERYEGEMINFTGRSFDLSVTPNHRMAVQRRSQNFDPNRFDMVPADEVAKHYENSSRRGTGNGRIGRGWRLPVTPPNGGGGKRPERIGIPDLPTQIRAGHGVQIYWIETEDFMRLVGWYVSEGHADSFEHGRSGGRISIAQSPQKNPNLYSEIEEMFIRIGLPPSKGANQVTVWCRNLAWFLREEFGHGSREKLIPRWVLDLHPDLLTILRDTMMKGDGSKAGDSYASISTKIRDAFQEICLRTGWRAGIANGEKIINLGSIQTYPEIRRTPERYHYSGHVGCATVPNGTLIVRRNGKPSISGNSNHYEYTPSYRDFGHTDSNEHFWRQMDYLSPELLRILRPGRIYACHTKDRIMFGNVTGKGAPTVSPFHAEAIFHYQRHGFDYMGMITVVTDVVRENNQTYRLGWTENSKDGTKMGVGSPEYVLLFRKPQSDRTKGYADVPVAKSKGEYTRARWQIDAHAFWRDSGERLLTADELAAMGPDLLAKAFTERSLKAVYNYDEHVRVGESLELRGALPATFMAIAPGSHDPAVWHDVDRMRTLNGEQVRRNLAMHVCPLQFGIVDRLIGRYTNPGEIVFDPFGGLMTVPYRAVALGRRGYGVELNHEYWADGVKYCRAAELEVSMPTLFSFVGAEAA